jgi:hypothetical protein
MPVAGIGIDGGDNPVGGHSAGDGEASVVALLEILADHRGQQSGRLGHLGAERPAVQQDQTDEGVFGPRIDQLLPGVGGVPVDVRLGVGGVVIALLINDRNSASNSSPAASNKARTAERINTMVSIVATVCHTTAWSPAPSGRPPGRPCAPPPPSPRRSAGPDSTHPGGPHVAQHGEREPRVVDVQPTKGVLPASVDAERRRLAQQAAGAAASDASGSAEQVALGAALEAEIAGVTRRQM